MAGFIELTLDQGATFSASIDLANDDGSAMNIDGYTFSSQIRKSYYSANATANLVITITNAATGNILMQIDSANTSNIKPGRYLFDLKMANTTTDSVTRVLEGIVTVTPQVTR